MKTSPPPPPEMVKTVTDNLYLAINNVSPTQIRVPKKTICIKTPQFNPSPMSYP